VSRVFGDYRQNGYVVPNLDEAIAGWAAVGVGPFYRFDGLGIVDFRYRESCIAPALNVALGNFGDVQLELIQPRDRAPSPWGDFLAGQPNGGLHHVAVWTQHFDSDLARWARQGLVPDCTGRVDGFARFGYFRSSVADGTSIEVVDVGASDLFPGVSALIRLAARTWDGTRATRHPDELFALLNA